jgi:hypothetical protein
MGSLEWVRQAGRRGGNECWQADSKSVCRTRPRCPPQRGRQGLRHLRTRVVCSTRSAASHTLAPRPCTSPRSARCRTPNRARTARGSHLSTDSGSTDHEEHALVRWGRVEVGPPPTWPGAPPPTGPSDATGLPPVAEPWPHVTAARGGAERGGEGGEAAQNCGHRPARAVRGPARGAGVPAGWGWCPGGGHVQSAPLRAMATKLAPPRNARHTPTIPVSALPRPPPLTHAAAWRV